MTVTTDRPVTQDMDLVVSVIKAAKSPGYVVIGSSERVYRCTCEGVREVERVPDYEDGAVHQLIEQKLLTIGGGHTVSYQGQEGRANSVLVPKRTLMQMYRWESYVRPSSLGPKRYVNSPRER
jgi:5-formaminoimidazole-4-carboxamide-1-beta-D-ribofuranosyl 5'-monophosphate synthetase